MKPNTLPVKRKKQTTFIPTSFQQVIKAIREEAVLNGLDHLEIKQISNVIESFHIYIERFAREGKPFFVSYFGYFTPNKWKRTKKKS